ncbi:MAG: cadmium-translocating P-type ATPase [Clostridiales bacterium]|nr:cadmium-translocating P-type ATPase [Clostridiales bacterium]
MKIKLRLILFASALFAAGFFFENGKVWRIVLMLGAYVLVGYDVLWRASRNISRGKIFDENFLMSLATIGAVIIGQYAEAVAVMVFYQTGELFQDYAIDRSRRSIAQTMDLRPDSANLITASGIIAVDPQNIKVGDMILIRPGEKVPLDGIVEDGITMLDTAALTGEPLPKEVRPGDNILSGCVNLSGVISLRVNKIFGESTISQILEMVEHATDKKSRQEKFITRFSEVYTPIVVVSALLLAFLPPLLVQGAELSDWVYRSLNFLVVSCPCALVISIPLSFFGGIGGASRAGILVKGSNHMEALAKAQTFVFDKTGTLTLGSFSVQKINPARGNEKTLLELAALAESQSNHPIAQSIRQSHGQTLDANRVQNIEEMAGGGVSARIDGIDTLIGTQRMLNERGVVVPQVDSPGTVTHISQKGEYHGHLIISDKIKPCAKEALQRLRARGVKQLVMLTGDNEQVGRITADRLNIDLVFAGLLPQDKVIKLEELLAQPNRRGTLAFVGDGVNDAPVLARADVGIAMGALGSDAAIEAADIVIMNDDPCKMASALDIARRTVHIAKQNAGFALSVKALVLGLSAFGLSTLWMAVFADVGVTILVILNAMRALRVPKEAFSCSEDSNCPVKTV